MDSALSAHRLHFAFAFAVTFRYLFSQLTMGLATVSRARFLDLAVMASVASKRGWRSSSRGVMIQWV
jgi:hypothetical protein